MILQSPPPNRVTDTKRKTSSAASMRDGRAPIKIAQFGLGPIGVESLRLLAAKPWARIVGGVDIDPAKVGKSLAELGAGDRFEKQKCYNSFNELWENEQPEVIVHTAGSKLGPAIEQITPMATA